MRNHKGSNGRSTGKQQAHTGNVSTVSWSGHRPTDVRNPGQSIPTPVAGAPAIQTTAVSPREVYGAELPPKGFIPFYRAQSIAATSVTGVPVGSFFEVVLESVPTGTGVLLYDVEYKWLEDNTDPLDPSALSQMQDNQAINGTITFDLLVDGSPATNQEQNLYDPATATSSRRSGWAQLNSNLLLFGNSPSVLYVKQSQILTARFYHNRTPGNPPTALYVSLKGYSSPYTNFQKVTAKTSTV